ncbi:MAG: bifunctional 3,4-dihydroxy-2-butanone-4-phosphate synthase/GTP cyclohydrolase II [Pseudomonadota bacterium]
MNSTDELLDDLRAGRMVILMDDESRENEGDLVMAAERTRPEDINFMASYGRGLICLTLLRERCQQLRLPLMVNQNQAAHGTNFTVSIEAASGVTTGISAADRARTIQAAVSPSAHPEDLVQPGHIFPLMAQAGGVLNRAGHTEAGCDLARLAGFEPAATIVEILNPDGSMARRPDLEQFAKEHSLKIGTIEDLIRYRIQNERTVERVAETEFPNKLGEFDLYAYQDMIDNAIHFALIKGDIDPAKPIPVRVHVEDILVDHLGAAHGGGWPMWDAMQKIVDIGGGALVILRKPEDPGSLIRNIEHYRVHGGRPSEPEVDASDAANTPEDLRTYGVGAQIISDLGIRKMSLLSAPKIFHGLAGFDLEIVDYITD